MRSCSRSAAGVCATVRAGLAGLPVDGDPTWNRPISPQADSTKAEHNRVTAAQRRRLVQVSRPPAHPVTAATRSFFRELIPAKQLNLPRMERFNSRPAARLDPAADTNPSIFERLRRHAGRLECRQHAP